MIKLSPVTGPIIHDDIRYEFTDKWGDSIRFYDDGYGYFWLRQNSLGTVCIIRAATESEAHDIYLDEFADRVAVEDLHEAYGLDSQEELNAKVDEKKETEDPYLDLIEGYEYMPNGSGTSSVVSLDLNGEHITKLTPAHLEELEITMRIIGEK